MSLDTFLEKEDRKPFSSAKAVFKSLCKAFPGTEWEGPGTISVFHEGEHMADVVLYGSGDALNIESDGASPVHWLTVSGSGASSDVVDFLDDQYSLVECRDDSEEEEEGKEAPASRQPPITGGMPPASDVFVARDGAMFCESISLRPGIYVEIDAKEVTPKDLDRLPQILAFYDANLADTKKSIQKGCRNYLSKSPSGFKFTGFWMMGSKAYHGADCEDVIFHHLVSVKLNQGPTEIKMETIVCQGKISCTDINAEDIPAGY